MRTKCPYSGIAYNSGSFFSLDTPVIDPYPIFKLPLRDILAKARKYGQGLYSETEERLIFLALLHKTDAVDFEVPADPDRNTIRNNLEPLFSLLYWYEKISPGMMKLPRMRVSSYNSNLSNINSFIRAWYEVRQEWMRPSRNKLLADLLESRENKLHKLIHSSHKNLESYLGILASWAIDAAGVDNSQEYPDKRETWISIIKTKPDEAALKLDIDELKDIVDTMEANLYAPHGPGYGSGSIQASKVLAHLHRLLDLKKNGLLGFITEELGGPSQTFKILSSPETSMETISSTEDSLLERLNEEFPNLSDEAPKREDYPGKLSDWVRAKAAWVRREQVKEDLDYVRHTRIKKSIEERGL